MAAGPHEPGWMRNRTHSPNTELSGNASMPVHVSDSDYVAGQSAYAQAS